MGFNYYNFGNIRECSLQDGTLHVRDPFGRVTKYQIDLQERTAWQQNIFITPYIAFVLYTNDNREIIGRFDGSITLYKDNLMVGLSSWKPKDVLNVVQVGYYCGSASLHSIVVDMDDRQTLFVDDLRYEALLPTPLSGTPNLTTALALAEQRTKESVILMKGGVSIEVPIWSIQDTLRIGTCRDFV